MRQKLRRENPDADEAQIERMLDDWFARRPGAEFGDGDGTPVTLPRAST
jgi:Rv0078B-related antitoxin